MAKILYISIRALVTLVYPPVFVIYMSISIVVNVFDLIAGNTWTSAIDGTKQWVRILLSAFKDMWA